MDFEGSTQTNFSTLGAELVIMEDYVTTNFNI